MKNILTWPVVAGAALGIVGLLAGVFAGIFFFKRGFSLGKSGEQSTASSIVPIFIVIALFIALITQFRFGENLPIFFSEKARRPTCQPMAFIRCWCACRYRYATLSFLFNRCIP